MTTILSEDKLNGWKIEDLDGVAEMVREQPEAGKLTFRTRFDWDAGFAGDARTEEIEQLGEIIPRKFTLRGDHPPEHLGHNTGPTAVELLLAALGSCITVTYAAHATVRGIKIDELQVSLDGDIDLNGFLQIRPMRAGFDAIGVTVRVKSDADDDALQEVLEAVRKASPVFDSVSRPVSVDASLERIS